ncbi:MAG: hypothetical protein QOE36_7 [Gaiellaceae bacterium]|jgi:lipoprotein-anchoring transpeptidase ErfK/SrfK|nr:hypothetical protein [Gaiellaceae bacterium]
MYRLLLAIPLAAAAAFFAAPAAEQPLVPIPHGVTVDGVPVGGLTVMPARSRLVAALARPLRIEWRGKVWRVSPDRFTGSADVNDAVGKAFHARPGRNVSLEFGVDGWAVHLYTRRLAHDFARGAANAAFAGVDTRLHPLFREGRTGRAVRQPELERALVEAVRTGRRTAITLPVRVTKPALSAESFGSVIVIERGGNRLTLYDGKKLVRIFGVATGQAAYPTPSGTYEVVVMQRDPTWTPPNSPWAAGAKPIPPGPGNPLGTRWMGLSAPGVGIHGTPDDASIGYSASHGCIRMHVPDAEWLFEHVQVGTPVVIV